MSSGKRNHELELERLRLERDIEEYRRVYDAGKLDNEEDWIAWFKARPALAYWFKWHSNQDRAEVYERVQKGDKYLLDMYFAQLGDSADEAVVSLWRSGRVLLAVGAFVAPPITFFVWPILSGKWWMLVVAMVGYWISTFIGKMSGEP